MSPSIIEGPYFRDLLAQPAAINATLAALRDGPDLSPWRAKLHNGEYRRLVLTGMGSSYAALYSILGSLVARGITAVIVETSELIHGQRAWLRERAAPRKASAPQRFVTARSSCWDPMCRWSSSRAKQKRAN